MSDSDRVFEALSSSVRRGILVCLRDGPRYAGAIADQFEMSKPAMSKHLSLLEAAGLIWRRRQGQYVLYGLEQGQLSRHLLLFVQELTASSTAPDYDRVSASDAQDMGEKVAAS